LVLAFAAVPGVVAFNVGHNSDLGLTVERNAPLLAKEFFARGAG